MKENFLSREGVRDEKEDRDWRHLPPSRALLSFSLGGSTCWVSSCACLWVLCVGVDARVESTWSAGLNLPPRYHGKGNKLSRPLHSRDTAAGPCGIFLSTRKTAPFSRL